MPVKFLICRLVIVGALSCVTASVGSVAAQTTTEIIALVGGRVIPSPDTLPIDDAVIVIKDGKIVDLGSRVFVSVPSEAIVIDCTDLTIVAGFQNNHVHFTEEKWADAGSQSAETLTENIQSMLTSYGYTTVVDTASLLANTVAIQARIEAGEIEGPRILTAGLPLYPPDGIPYYVKDTVPPEVLQFLQQPATSVAAIEAVNGNLNGGADIIKLFTGSWISREEIVVMPADIVSAAVTEAHQHGRLVFTHPSDVRGLEVAIDSDVDVLAHAIDDVDGLTTEHFEVMKERDIALIPTLMLLAGDGRREVLDQVSNYQKLGGQILFGTDVGFLTDYNPAREYELMEAAGLTWRDILASLTTNPASLFGESEQRGALAKDMEADIVILGTEPSAGPHAFTDVRYTIRAGRVIYSKL